LTAGNWLESRKHRIRYERIDLEQGCWVKLGRNTE
jgi:hypothetical protein